VPISTELQADEARQIFYPYEMSHVVIVLYVQQVNMPVQLRIGESYRKNGEFLFLFNAVYVDGNVIEIFKLFNLI